LRHFLSQLGDYACHNTPPASVSNSRRTTCFEYHSEAVGRKDSNRNTRFDSPQCITIACFTSRFYLQNCSSMSLTGGSPLIWNLTVHADSSTGINVIPHVTISCLGE
jgi:hypothetical protein